MCTRFLDLFIQLKLKGKMVSDNMQNFIVKKFSSYVFLSSLWLFGFILPLLLTQLAEIKMENVSIIQHAMELFL